jgi:CHRD domain
MDATARPGLFVKKIPITDTLLSAFISGKLYLNLSTTAIPSGEIRGQLKTSLRRVYYFDLCGSQQVPKNSSTALGMACGSVDQNECYFHYVILHDGLSGNVISADLHQGKTGQNGMVLHPVDKPGVWIDENEDLEADEGPAIEKQETYFKVNTAQNADGEVRGQVKRGLTCPLVSGVKSADIQSLVFFPNPILSGQSMQIQLYSLKSVNALFYLVDMNGRTVLEYPLVLNVGAQNHDMELPKLPSGSYQVVLERVGQVDKLWSGTIQVF